LELPSIAAQDWHTPTEVGRESVSLLHPVISDADVEGLRANAGQFARCEGGEQCGIDIDASVYARFGKWATIAADGEVRTCIDVVAP